MSDSYVKMPTTEAKRLAEQTIEVIMRLRNQRWNESVQFAQRRHHWWSWLPWWKPISDSVMQQRLMRHDNNLIGLLWWRPMDRAKAILNLVRACGSDPFITIGSEDLERIQFGQTYEDMGRA